MNQRINDEALHALTAPGFASTPHMCQRWVREVVQAVYGSRYDRFWKSTALLTGASFHGAGLFVPLGEGSVPGDLLYKLHGSGGDGHVGIRILGNQVAENSSVHWDGRDARGCRSLTEFGNFDLIVRLS